MKSKKDKELAGNQRRLMRLRIGIYFHPIMYLSYLYSFLVLLDLLFIASIISFLNSSLFHYFIYYQENKNMLYHIKIQ